MLFPVSRTKVLFVSLPSTLPGRLFIEYYNVNMFLMPGVYLSPKYTYMSVYLAGARCWLKRRSVSTWEPAAVTTDSPTSAWERDWSCQSRAGALCMGTRGGRRKGSSRDAEAVLLADTGAFARGLYRTCPISLGTGFHRELSSDFFSYHNFLQDVES